MIPMTASSKRQELYLGPGQTSMVVRDLTPDEEYQINLFALKDMARSEPITITQRTEPVKLIKGRRSVGIFKPILMQQMLVDLD